MKNTISIRKINISDDVLAIIPFALAHSMNVLPLSFENNVLTVAVPPGKDIIDIIDAVESETNLPVDYLIADNTDDLAVAIKRYYPEDNLTENNSAAGLFNIILNRALQLRASDIHICPKDKHAEIQMRIDGELRIDRTIDLNTLNELTAVIKIAADLDIAEKRTPLDGSININLGNEEINLRAATIPTIHGEHITLRLLTQDHDDELEKIESLGMSNEHQKILLNILNDPNGIIMLSGPTGSGKTTTLYAALRHLRQKDSLHLVSIEDPVEKPVEGVTQIKIDADGDRLTFNKALRSVLRHDPDVIMIGEIRDSETGDIAVKSALTGHLVLSTLHTNSAPGVLTRLVNIGIAPYLVASTLRLAIAQRLVKCPCPHCMQTRRPTAEECREFNWDVNDETLRVPEIKGCSFCDYKGYSGRIGIYEMIPIDDVLRKMLLNNADELDFEKYVFGTRGMTSLKKDGAAKILALQTTIDEVKAVTNSNF